ncbi:MAG TPA: hypothetical protein VJG30_01710 [Candidatus Nanoarchaeia archaeon]|nr:hypothetical protein [Candidatus Nanoarchaeia archaeon]
MPTLNIYFNSVYGRRELERLLQIQVPVVLSVTPKRFTEPEGVAKYPEWFAPLLKDFISIPEVIIAQRGFSHRCLHRHFSWIDQWHENGCPYKLSLDGELERQKELMEKGRDEIIKYLGVAPKAYAPPNHIFNSVTLSLAAELGYEFFMTRATTQIGKHRHNSLIVFPESYIGEKGKSDNFYVHYDHIEGEESKKFNKSERTAYETVLAQVIPLTEVKLSNPSLAVIISNEARKMRYKYGRDLSNLARKLKVRS